MKIFNKNGMKCFKIIWNAYLEIRKSENNYLIRIEKQNCFYNISFFKILSFFVE